jgi:NADH:ubiquinone oxidoreductase subunit 2 (subunit N)
MESNLDKRYQTLVVLWLALLLSVGMYFLMFSVFFAPAVSIEPGNPPSFLLMVTLTTLGAFLVVASFAVKRKLLERSVQKQDVNLVQKGLVIACAMCEVSALLGVLELKVIGNREYYLLFIFAAVGIAFHFPRRSQLEAASYKNPAQLS